MKILFITNRYHPAIGGVEILAKEWAEGLAEKGHEITIFTTSLLNSATTQKVDAPDQESINGVNIKRFNASRLKKDPLTYSASMHAEVIKQQEEYDLIFSFTYGYHTSFIPALNKKMGRLKKPVIFVPCYAPNDNFPDLFLNLFDKTLGKLTVTHADKIIMLTEAEKDFFISQGKREEDLAVIPPIVNPIPEVNENLINSSLRDLGISQDKKLILSLSRVVEYKGVQHVINGFNEMLKIYPELREQIELVIAGDGDYLDTVKNLANSLKLNEQIKFVGRVSEEQKVALMKSSEIFTLLSYSGESFGITLVEAMSAGCKIVGSNIGAIPWVVKDQINGLIVDPFMPQDVAKAFGSLIKENALNEKIRENNLLHSKEYSKESIVARLEVLLSSNL